MTELEIAGIGIWSPYFSDWQAFCAGIDGGGWQADAPLRPGLIPAKELRRSPQSVKMAVEVLGQACAMAALDPAGMAVVFSSSMGDIQITDYLCRVLADTPALVSPTRFHNSVHNATTGYWSIASHTHAPTNAVSAYEHTAPMALVEAAIQAVEEDAPVLLVCQEMAAPEPLHFACPSDHPFAMALLLTKPGIHARPLAAIQLGVHGESADWPALPAELATLFSSNFGARLLPMMAAVADGNHGTAQKPLEFMFPLSQGSALQVLLKSAGAPGTAHG